MKVLYPREFRRWEEAVPYLRLLLAGLSVRSSGFNPRVVIVGFAMERWLYARLYFQNFVCQLLIPVPPILLTYLSPGAGVICSFETRVQTVSASSNSPTSSGEWKVLFMFGKGR
jgi:hypothetical protein